MEDSANIDAECKEKTKPVTLMDWPTTEITEELNTFSPHANDKFHQFVVKLLHLRTLTFTSAPFTAFAFFYTRTDVDVLIYEFIFLL